MASTKMESHQLSGWLALGALVLTIGGPIPLSAYAQTHDQQQATQKETSDRPGGEKVADKDVALMALVKASPALAAPTPVPKPPAPPASFSWTGVYVGGHIGYGAGKANTNFTPLPTAVLFINMAPTTLDPDPSGVLGGGQVGYNWQSGSWVIGIEADFTGAEMDGTATITPITQNNGTPFPGAGFLSAHQDTDWIGTVRPRVGFTPVPRLLLYATGGLSFGHVNYSANSDFRPGGTIQYPAAFDRTKAGWNAGAGAEIGWQHWSVRAQYLYYDLGEESIIANPVPANPPFQVGYRWETQAHTFDVGLNYRF